VIVSDTVADDHATRDGEESARVASRRASSAPSPSLRHPTHVAPGSQCGAEAQLFTAMKSAKEQLMRTTTLTGIERRRTTVRLGALVGAVAVTLATLVGATSSASAVMTPVEAASADAPTLQDYWNGDADWTFVKKTTATQSGIASAFDGQQIRTMPDGTWYRFSRNWGTGECQMSTEVRASTDQGATWSDPERVVGPEASTAWSCNATDGGAIYNQEKNRWYYLFQ